MTPSPGPPPYAALGCFAALVFGGLAFVVLGASFGDWLFYPVLIVSLLSLVLVFVRLLARRHGR